MKENIFTIITNRPWLKKDDISMPKPATKSVPEWFRQADRFAKNPITGSYFIGPDKAKIPTFKACPALLDIYTTGYMLHTPCDIEFFINESGIIDVKITDDRYKDFVSARPPMPQFEHPHGYHKHHFSWLCDWGIKLPNGYSAIYLSPANRFDLPFYTVEGIVDNDAVNLPGFMPFFVQDNFIGVIPAGTPYAQIIPFKRENWKSEILVEDRVSMWKKNVANSNFYRVPDGGIYKNKVWQKRRYE